MWSWEVGGREKLLSRILNYSLVCESAWVIFELLAQVLVSPWKSESYLFLSYCTVLLGRDDLGFLLFLTQLSSDFSSHNYPPAPRQQTVASPALTDLHCPHPFLSAKTSTCLLTDGHWRSHCDWTIQPHRKAAAKKQPSFASQPKESSKEIPELESLGSFQSFLDSFKNCSPFLRERGRQCDCVAPRAHWQNKRTLLFQKEHKDEQEGPPDRERENSRSEIEERVVRPRHEFKIYPNATLLEVPQIPVLQSQRSRAWAWKDQMKWVVFLNLEPTIPYFMKTNDSSHGKAQKFPHVGHWCPLHCLVFMFLELSQWLKHNKSPQIIFTDNQVNHQQCLGSSQRS